MVRERAARARARAFIFGGCECGFVCGLACGWSVVGLLE